MAEVKDLENVEQEATAPAMEETAADSAAPAETRVNLKARWQAIPRKKRRRIIRLCILALLLVIAAVVLLKVLGGKSSDEGEAVTDIVQYGSITSTVQGSGLTKAKSSETITITTVGTVVDVLVAEGETVTAGTPLFTIDSPAAETAVQKARSNVEGYEKQLSQAQKDIAGLNLSARHAGKQAYARGVIGMRERMPYRQMQEAASRLLNHFGRRTYYRVRKGERPLSPNEQKNILNILEQCGIGDPGKFDAYFETYDW